MRLVEDAAAETIPQHVREIDGLKLLAFGLIPHAYRRRKLAAVRRQPLSDELLEGRARTALDAGVYWLSASTRTQDRATTAKPLCGVFFLRCLMGVTYHQ